MTVQRTRAELLQLAKAKYELNLRTARVEQSRPFGGLSAFVRYFWDVLEPNEPLVEGWPLEAVCMHLEAVTRGEIKRLLMNVPPGFMKSLLTDVFWPAWEWSAQDMPYMRYVAFSYAAHLTERDNGRFLMLLQSRKFQELWGHKFKLTKAGEIKVGNDKTGWKFASSVKGIGTGERGNRVIVDDPHNVKEGESEAVRAETVRWFRESLSDRFNNMSEGVLIVIMQRVHEEDVSGVIIEQRMNYVHLMIPMEFDPGRKCTTSIGWSDPRTYDGELAWEERFPASVIENIKIDKGPYAYVGQYQQSPEPRGGGIIKREWWQVWEGSEFPPMSYRWACADTAYTEKEENDPTGFTVWGLWEDQGQPKIMLLDAWRKRLEIHGPNTWVDKRSREERLAAVKRWQSAAMAQYRAGSSNTPYPQISPDIEPWLTFIETGQNSAARWPGESMEAWTWRTQEQWGLCEWLAYSCRRFNIDKLLIEGKASGLSVAQELYRLHGTEGWGIETTVPEGDKVARLYAVQATFSAGLVYAPDREWANLVIDEVSSFPKGRYRDLTDSTSMALRHIRDSGRLIRPEERYFIEQQRATHHSQLPPLYPG